MQINIDTWKAYLEAGGKQSATELGIFFIKHAEQLEAQRSGFQESAGQGFAGAVLPQDRAAIPMESIAGILVGRLQRFVFLEAKPRLKEAGLENADDFGLLAALYYKPGISKGQLLKQSLIEPATGTEMLKRMRKAGLIDEKPNPDDGRSLLVCLTPKGRTLTEACFFQLQKINNTLETLTEPEKGFLISILDKLDHFHSHRHGIKTIGTWMGEGAATKIQDTQ